MKSRLGLTLLIVAFGIVGTTLLLFREPGYRGAGRKLIPKDGLKVLENGGEFILLSLDYRPWMKSTNNFHGFPIVGKIEIKDPVQRHAILDALYEGVAYNGLEAACFDPRFGIHAKMGNQIEDVVICFECNQVYFYGVTQGKLLTSGAPAGIFNRVLSDAHVSIIE